MLLDPATFARRNFRHPRGLAIDRSGDFGIGEGGEGSLSLLRAYTPNLTAAEALRLATRKEEEPAAKQPGAKHQEPVGGEAGVVPSTDPEARAKGKPDGGASAGIDAARVTGTGTDVARIPITSSMSTATFAVAASDAIGGGSAMAGGGVEASKDGTYTQGGVSGGGQSDASEGSVVHASANSSSGVGSEALASGRISAAAGNAASSSGTGNGSSQGSAGQSTGRTGLTFLYQ